jgi:CRISPR/Cas system-associated exonuclease Cas4 (RecB family)
MTVVEPGLNPAQREVLEVLGASRDEWPEFDPELRHHLREHLETTLAPLAHALDRVGATPRTFTKHDLSTIHGCEERFLAEADAGFPGWSVPRARGVVAHKAIELSMHVRDDLVPLRLVDESLARLTEKDSSLGAWLQGVTEYDRAELKGEAVDRVNKFLECWPKLKAVWRPVLESSMRVDLCDERISLRGKVDLTLGMASGTAAGKVLVDLKTGAFSTDHLHDLRFYALLETLRLGVPPRRVASYYLDAGRFVPADITVDALEAAAQRLVDGVEVLVELLAGGRPPQLRAGPACRWCPLLDGCIVGRALIGERD